jgi:hypothetical protein
MKNSLEIDRDYGIEILVGHNLRNLAILPLHELIVPQDAGIVYEHVNAAPAIHDLRNRRFHVRGIGDIRFAEYSSVFLLAQLLANLGLIGGVQIPSGNAAALRGKSSSRGAANARSRAGHDDDFVV